jgi:hypothetical protein
LHLNEATFKAFTTSHHSAAKRLRHVLVDLSHGHRGHMFAPSPERKNIRPEDMPNPLPRLLIESCDHQPSCKHAYRRVDAN